jgi:hypothetical protein
VMTALKGLPETYFRQHFQTLQKQRNAFIKSKVSTLKVGTLAKCK